MAGIKKKDIGGSLKSYVDSQMDSEVDSDSPF
jgi:hypothetical protein